MQEARELANDPRPKYRVYRRSTGGLCYSMAFPMRILTLRPPPVRALRTIFLCVFLHHGRIFTLLICDEMWALGMGLHPAWACGYRFRRGVVSFSDPAACRIPISSAEHHAPHAQRPV